jgi:hypothetical protein
VSDDDIIQYATYIVGTILVVAVVAFAVNAVLTSSLAVESGDPLYPVVQAISTLSDVLPWLVAGVAMVAAVVAGILWDRF